MQGVEKKPITRLVFAYDANSGRLAAVADSLKKLVGRGCPLCALTHSAFGKREEFLAFEDSLLVPIEYLHRDEARRDPRARGLDLPCIFAEIDGEDAPVVLLGPAALEHLRGSEGALKGQLLSRATALGLEFPDGPGARVPGP